MVGVCSPRAVGSVRVLVNAPLVLQSRAANAMHSRPRVIACRDGEELLCASIVMAEWGTNAVLSTTLGGVALSLLFPVREFGQCVKPGHFIPPDNYYSVETRP